MSERKRIEEAIRKAVRGILAEMITEDGKEKKDDEPDLLGMSDKELSAYLKKQRAASKDEEEHSPPGLEGMSDKELDDYLASKSASVELSPEDEERLTGAIDSGKPFKSKLMRDEDPFEKRFGKDDDEEEEEEKPKDAKGKKKDDFAKGGAEMSQQQVADKLGISQQLLNYSENEAMNKFSNRAAYLGDVLAGDDTDLFDEFINQATPQQLKKLFKDFEESITPTTFVDDYVQELLRANDGGKDDITPQEAEYMRSKPEIVANSPEFKAYEKKLLSNKKAVILSNAFFDHTRDALPFQKFVNSLVDKEKEKRGETDGEKAGKSRTSADKAREFLEKSAPVQTFGTYKPE